MGKKGSLERGHHGTKVRCTGVFIGHLENYIGIKLSEKKTKDLMKKAERSKYGNENGEYGI